MPYLNVTLPVYNEAPILAQTVETVTEFLQHNSRTPFEIVIANNGSDDDTKSIAESLAARDHRVRVVNLAEKGRGRALKKVWLESEAELLTYMDCDLSTDLDHLPLLVQNLSCGDYDVVIGSRLLPNSRTKRGFRRELISRGYNALLKLCFGASFTDAQCGFKGITQSAARRLLPLIKDNEWFADTELLVLAEKNGCRICEFPVKWTERDGISKVKIFATILSDIVGIIRLRRSLCQSARAVARRHE
jgi:glycosyltransferase involved in cell wall biosynthesis